VLTTAFVHRRGIALGRLPPERAQLSLQGKHLGLEGLQSGRFGVGLFGLLQLVNHCTALLHLGLKQDVQRNTEDQRNTIVEKN
jgi:hypothetical protein